METHELITLDYQDSKGRIPFRDWLSRLKDVQAKTIILARIERLEEGNLGNCRSLAGGIIELKIFFGPGYRVYFGKDGDTHVILLCGGDKKTQSDDIARARRYWIDYNSGDL